MHNTMDLEQRMNLEQWINEALHDLCQPVTALQCRLFLASLAAPDASRASMDEALREALTQCERVMERVRQMQTRMEMFEAEGRDAVVTMEAA